MNCRDIARLLDDEDVRALPAAVHSDVQAHLATCRECARDWQIHAQLAEMPIPALPAGLRAQFMARAAQRPVIGAHRRNRFLVIGAVVAMAAAAAVLTLQVDEPAPPAAAAVEAAQAEPVTSVASEAFAQPAEPLSVDDSAAVQEWTLRVAEWLAVRDDADALLTAAVLLCKDSSRHDTRVRELLRRATAMAPDDARIHATAMLIVPRMSRDDAMAYAQALRRIAPDNALGWAPEVERSFKAGDSEALRNALAAMSRARTFDMYWGASTVSMTAQIRSARVAPPDIKGPGPRIAVDMAGILAAAALPIFAFPPLRKSCESATEQGMLLECRRIGAAMRAGDTLLVNVMGFSVSGLGLPADSEEMRSLEQQKKRVRWIERMSQRAAARSPDDPQAYLRVLAEHPRELDALRALVEAHGMPTEPPADWKP